ncbi:MAG: hypothetical protein RIM99_18105 [Cyclobacteriaceae bacterium]
MIDVGLFLSYILIGVCALTAIGMPLVKAFGDPQSLKKMAMGVGAVVVVFVVSYLIADGTAYEEASSGTSKMVGAGLITMYILAILAIGGIVFTEIQKMFE